MAKMKFRSNKSRGNKSRGNKSRGNKSRGNKSRGNKSRGNKFRSNKFRSNKSRSNKSRRNLFKYVGGAVTRGLKRRMDEGINLRDQRGVTALHRACEVGNIEIIMDLIDNGADLNIQDNWGQTPFFCLCRKGGIDPDIIISLVDRGANVNIQDNTGKTPIMVLYETGDNETIMALVDRGADLNIQNIHGSTLLMLACEKRDLGTVMTLLDRRVKLNLQEVNKGKTALMISLRFGHSFSVDIALALLEKGANPNIVDQTNMNDNVTALELVIDQDESDIVKQMFLALIEKGADIHANPDLIAQVMVRRHLETAEVLIDNGIDVNIVFKTYYPGMTALDAAIKSGFIDLAFKLMMMGANFDDDMDPRSRVNYEKVLAVKKAQQENLQLGLRHQLMKSLGIRQDQMNFDYMQDRIHNRNTQL
jgi:ankyrin repeat protein